MNNLARKLNRQVTIERLSGAVDEIGQPGSEWEPLATVWAHVRHLSGLETIKAGAEAAVGKASIRIRYRTDITAAMRVVLGGTTYQITAVLPDEERREFVDLTCEVHS